MSITDDVSPGNMSIAGELIAVRTAQGMTQGALAENDLARWWSGHASRDAEPNPSVRTFDPIAQRCEHGLQDLSPDQERSARCDVPGGCSPVGDLRSWRCLGEAARDWAATFQLAADSLNKARAALVPATFPTLGWNDIKSTVRPLMKSASGAYP